MICLTRRKKPEGGGGAVPLVVGLPVGPICFRESSGVRIVGYPCTHCGSAAGEKLLLYYRDSAKIQNLDCPVAGHQVPMDVIDDQVGDLVKRLVLPDDWREPLQELASHQEERENIEGQRRYVQGKLKRLRELYLDGDFAKAEYDQRKAELQAKLHALQVPEQPAIEAAGETLESLGAEWANAPKRYQREMLRVIFEAVYVDVAARAVICVKPYPQFAPLFRMDARERKRGVFMSAKKTKKLDPRVERLLQLIIEVRKARQLQNMAAKTC